MPDEYELKIERRGSLDGWDGVLFVDGELVLQTAGRLGDVITKLISAIDGEGIQGEAKSAVSPSERCPFEWLANGVRVRCGFVEGHVGDHLAGLPE